MQMLQEFFDTAYRGLAAQGFRKSVGPFGSCAYRAQNGLRCALGHCIPDDRYSTSIEGAAPDTAKVASALGIIQAEQSILLDQLVELQRCHDCSTSPAEMRWELHDFAKEQGLSVPKISDLPA